MNRNLTYFSFLFIVIACVYALFMYPFNSWRKPLLSQLLESQVQSSLSIGAVADSDNMTSIFRGDFNRHGRYLGKISENLQIVWKTEKLFFGIHSASKASPVVDESGIYLGSDLGIFYRYSHDAKRIWSFQTDSGFQGIHGSAILTDKYVYFGNYAGYFYCLNKESGEVIWTTQIASAIGSSPIILNEKIIFSAEFSRPREGYLVALNRHTGQKIWVSAKFGEQVHASPAVDIDHEVVGVGHNGGYYLGVDLNSGQNKWEHYIGAPIKGTAIFVNQSFCFTSWSEDFFCLSTKTGEVLQQWKLSGRSQSSAAYSEKLKSFFVGSSAGVLSKLNYDGSRVDVVIGDPSSLAKSNMASPILVSTDKQEVLIMPCFANAICVIDPVKMKIKKRVDVGGTVTGSPTYWNNTIYVAVDEASLVALR